MAAAVVGVLVKNLTSPAVNTSEAGNRHVLGVARQKKAAALPAGVAVVVVKITHQIRHVGRVEAGDQLRAAFQMEIHIGFELDRAGEELPGRDGHTAAAGSAAGVDGLLDRAGVQRDPVSRRTEIHYGTIHVADTPCCNVQGLCIGADAPQSWGHCGVCLKPAHAQGLPAGHFTV